LIFYILILDFIILLLQALDAIANSDKELRKFELNEDEWNRIEEVVSVLMVNKLLIIFLG